MADLSEQETVELKIPTSGLMRNVYVRFALRDGKQTRLRRWLGFGLVYICARVLGVGKIVVSTRTIEETDICDCGKCGNACAYVEPYGWVPEAGCPLHDPDPFFDTEEEARIATEERVERYRACRRRGWDMGCPDIPTISEEEFRTQDHPPGPGFGISKALKDKPPFAGLEFPQPDQERLDRFNAALAKGLQLRDGDTNGN